MKRDGIESTAAHHSSVESVCSECGRCAHSYTFPYSFAGIVSEATCYATWRSDTPKAQRNPAALGRPGAGWGRRGGGLQCGHTYLRRALRGSEGASRGHSVESILGTGGAITSCEGGEDCQVPLRRLCLSLRGSAAGPEWRWAPRGSTLALGQRLEQPNARDFRSFAGFWGYRSELTHSALRPASGVRETPFPSGTVSHSFGTPFESGRLSRRRAGL